MNTDQIDASAVEKETRIEDIQFLQKNLETTHHNLYANVGKEEFTSALICAADLPEEDFPIGIQEALALLGDAHTKVPEVIEVWENRLPIRLREIDGHYYIIGTNEANQDLLHQEILQINGYDLDLVLEAISRLSSHENSERLKSDNERVLRSLSVLKYYGFIDDNVVSVTIGDGVQAIEIYEGNVTVIQPLGWNNKDIEYVGNYTYRYRITGDTMHFQYNACNNRGFTGEKLASFKQELLKAVQNCKNIVVDLRLNSGGSSGLMQDLFHNLPEHLKVYVANGRETFSSAMHHMLYLRRERGAVLVGENAGQKPNRFGDTEEITLPNSGLLIYCSFQYFELLPGEDVEVIEPDIYIPVTIDNFKNNTDPLMDWIVTEL